MRSLRHKGGFTNLPRVIPPGFKPRQAVLSKSSLCGLGKLSLHHIIEWISRSTVACSASRKRTWKIPGIPDFKAVSPGPVVLCGIFSQQSGRSEGHCCEESLNNLSQKVSHRVLHTWWHSPAEWECHRASRRSGSRQGFATI